MTDRAPVVSIIMPCYNAATHLPRSIGSVLAQSFTDWELIVVDDGSTDGTSAWLGAADDRRIRFLSQTNQGVSRARNSGLAVARGQYVSFLDADDSWETRFLEKMTAALTARPDAVLAYCGWQNIGLSGGRGRPFVPPDYETPDKQEVFFASSRWPIHGVLTRRDAIIATGGFDPSLANAEDYALWLTLVVDKPIVRVPEVLAYYHFHGQSQASANHARAALHRLAAQTAYLRSHPAFAARLGRAKSRDLVYGRLLRHGYECYWRRDLWAARAIFRAVMRHGYGSATDWKYMLPSLLPRWLHQRLLGMFRSNAANHASDRVP